MVCTLNRCSITWNSGLLRNAGVFLALASSMGLLDKGWDLPIDMFSAPLTRHHQPPSVVGRDYSFRGDYRLVTDLFLSPHHNHRLTVVKNMEAYPVQSHMFLPHCNILLYIFSTLLLYVPKGVVIISSS